MQAILSTTGDPKYLFLLPLTCFSWNQMGASCVVFYPERLKDDPAMQLVVKYCRKDTMFRPFTCPTDAEATYAQVSRLFASALPEIPQAEILVTGDVDMIVFKGLLDRCTGNLDIVGGDLLEGQEQYPMCYVSAPAGMWWYFMQIGKRTYQECLDLALGKEIVNADMRGNLWCRDQELIFRMIRKSGVEVNIIDRAYGCGRFAENRIDRDDAYFNDAIPTAHDYHMHRPGYTTENFQKIINVLDKRFPFPSWDWVWKYAAEFEKLIS